MAYTEKMLEFWGIPAPEMLQKLQTSNEGLSDFESSERLMKYGDNKFVAASISRQVGIKNSGVITGSEISEMTNEALVRNVIDTDIFAEVEPNQKEHIILAFKKAGNVVGYIGDGINDASALHAADVGISVDSAADVAKEAADIVLLEKSLDALIEGIKGGRETFANTLSMSSWQPVQILGIYSAWQEHPFSFLSCLCFLRRSC